HDVSKTGVIEAYSSTLPRRVRSLDVYHGIGDESPFRTKTGAEGGFGMWRWPEQIGLSRNGLKTVLGKDYSEEQYSVDLNHMDDFVRSRLATIPESPDEKSARLYYNLCTAARARIR